jgi:hypothetical protein
MAEGEQGQGQTKASFGNKGGRRQDWQRHCCMESPRVLMGRDVDIGAVRKLYRSVISRLIINLSLEESHRCTRSSSSSKTVDSAVISSHSRMPLNSMDSLGSNIFISSKSSAAGSRCATTREEGIHSEWSSSFSSCKSHHRQMVQMIAWFSRLLTSVQLCLSRFYPRHDYLHLSSYPPSTRSRIYFAISFVVELCVRRLSSKRVTCPDSPK